MGKVVISIKALPKDVAAKPEELANKIKEFLSKQGSVYRIEVQPLAFGLNIINVTFISDEALGTSKLEESFSSFKEANMSITDISRMPEV